VNLLLMQWEADQRSLRQFGQAPAERLTSEQDSLLPLPAGRLGREVCGNPYSVPESWCGRPVSIRIILNDELRVLDYPWRFTQ
jgi:hypothetical protein